MLDTGSPAVKQREVSHLRCVTEKKNNHSTDHPQDPKRPRPLPSSPEERVVEVRRLMPLLLVLRRDRQSSLDKGKQRSDEDEQYYSQSPERWARPEATQEGLDDEREDDPADGCPSGDDSVGESSSVDPPLVHPADDGSVEDRAAEGEEESLGDDKDGGLAGKRDDGEIKRKKMVEGQRQKGDQPVG